MDFSELKLHPDLLSGLDAMNFRSATPIQELAIPVILQGKDVIACAQTGTGKTAAYILPVINNILMSGHKGLNTLVLAPTRELAQQIDQQIDGFAYFLDISSISIYGGGDGSAWNQQRKALDEGVDIIIATPGRLLSFLALGKRQLPALKHLVLDEADRMLDMGFYEDIIKIVKNISAERQTLLFSATMPPRIRQLARSIMKDPEELNIAIAKPAEKITQEAYMTFESQKEPMLLSLLNDDKVTSAIVFASRKSKVKDLFSALKRKGVNAEAFHSDLEQEQRERIMRSFKSKNTRILVGTDVISRGIDVEGIDLVVNYDVPPDPEDYVHRVGRTARAERNGHAVTFINGEDIRKFQRIEALIGYEINKPALPLELGEGPEYQSDKRSSKGSFRGKKGHGKKNYHRKPKGKNRTQTKGKGS